MKEHLDRSHFMYKTLDIPEATLPLLSFHTPEARDRRCLLGGGELTPGTRIACLVTSPEHDNPLALQGVVVDALDETVDVTCNVEAPLHADYGTGLARVSHVARFKGTVKVPRPAVTQTGIPVGSEREARDYLLANSPGLTEAGIDKMAAAIAGINPGEDLIDIDVAWCKDDGNGADEAELDRRFGLSLLLTGLEPSQSREGAWHIALDQVDRDVEFNANLPAQCFGVTDASLIDVRLDCTYSEEDTTNRVVVARDEELAVCIHAYSGEYSDDDSDAYLRIDLVHGDATAMEEAIEEWLQYEASRVVGTLTGDCANFSDAMKRRVATLLRQRFPFVTASDAGNGSQTTQAAA